MHKAARAIVLLCCACSVCQAAMPVEPTTAQEADEQLDQIEMRALDRALPMEVRAKAIRDLVERGDFDIVHRLVQDPILRRPFSAYEEVHSPDTVAFCRNILELMLAEAGAGESIDRLCALIRSQKSPSLAYLARQKVANIGGENVIPRLVALAEDKDGLYGSRLDAIMALREIGSPSAGPALTRIAEDATEPGDMRELALATARHLAASGVPDILTTLAVEDTPDAGNESGSIPSEHKLETPEAEPASRGIHQSAIELQDTSALPSSGWDLWTYLVISLAVAASGWLILLKRRAGVTA